MSPNATPFGHKATKSEKSVKRTVTEKMQTFWKYLACSEPLYVAAQNVYINGPAMKPCAA